MNHRDPLAQSLNSTDEETEAQSHLFHLATHCLSTVLSPSQRACAGNADPHLRRPRYMPSPAPPQESRAEEQRKLCGVERGSVAISYPSGSSYFITEK